MIIRSFEPFFMQFINEIDFIIIEFMECGYDVIILRIIWIFVYFNRKKWEFLREIIYINNTFELFEDIFTIKNLIKSEMKGLIWEVFRCFILKDMTWEINMMFKEGFEMSDYRFIEMCDKFNAFFKIFKIF